MKDGRTHLAYKVEQAADLETEPVLSATVHPGDRGDPDSLPETDGLVLPEGTLATPPFPVPPRSLKSGVIQPAVKWVNSGESQPSDH